MGDANDEMKVLSGLRSSRMKPDSSFEKPQELRLETGCCRAQSSTGVTFVVLFTKLRWLDAWYV